MVCLALSVGAAFLTEALEFGLVDKEIILLATTPVLISPFIWMRRGGVPAAGAWVGDLLVAACSAVLVFQKATNASDGAMDY